MSLTSTLARNDYVGNGATSIYSYTFRIFEKTHLKVTTRDALGFETVLVVDIGYTVAGVGAATGGTITLLAGVLATGIVLTIRRLVPLTQPTDIRNQGEFFAEVHEDSFDRQVMQTQQQQDEIDRSLKLPETVSPAVVSAVIPVPVASDILVWNDTATALMGVNVGRIIPAGTFAFPGTNGMLAQVSAGVGAAREIKAGSGISMANGTGVAGNPTVSVATAGVTAAMLASSAIAQIFQARLTLASGIPVTVTNLLAQPTVFLTPYKGNRIALFDGTNWKLHALTEISLAVVATTSKMVDLFVYDASGVLTLNAVEWTNDTTRAVSLILQDGVLILNASPFTRRYVGSYRTTAVASQTEDSLVKRYLWNYYNRILRPMYVTETGNWTYSTDAFRIANANAANQIDFVIGVQEDAVYATAQHMAENSVGAVRMGVGIGLDSSTVSSALTNGSSENAASQLTEVTAEYRGFPGIGRHTLRWLETTMTGGTTTFRGSSGTFGEFHGGLAGELQG